MPRSARKKSSTGIYHIVLRGINKQPIFIDDEDNRVFLMKLLAYKKNGAYEIYAYCLMNNHIHLLMKEGNESLGTAFRRIGASYVYWYNWKYDRIGHLFQDRYRSETVETDDYFLTVMRYIHQNPVKAGMVDEVQTYPWSSYREYTGKPALCDTGFALKMFSKDTEEALKLWVRFNHETTNEKCLEYDNARRLNDSEAVDLIASIGGVKKPEEIKDLGKQKRNVIIKKLRENGMSIRQIERLTGVSFAVIREL